MAVTEPWSDCIVSLKVPALNRNAGEFFRTIAAVLITEDVFLADVLRTGRVLSQKLGRKVALAAILPENTKFTADELNISWFGHGLGLLVKSRMLQFFHQSDGGAGTVENVEVNPWGTSFQ